MLPVTLLEAILIASPLVAAHGNYENHEALSSTLRRAVPPGKDTSQTPRPKLGNVPYGGNIEHCTVPGKVALTFDDGPYAYTSELLDLLAANKVKATFFLNGNNQGGLISDPSRGWRDIVKRMFNEGHHIGSHSYTHADFDKVSTEVRKTEILYNEIAIADILGVFPTYFRPPYTHCGGGCQTDIVAAGYHVANYDVDTKDWEGDYTKARSNFHNAVAAGKPGVSSFISLAHDIHQETVKTLAQWMIDEVRKAGYEMVTMGDCLGDPKTNWYRNAVTGQAWDGKPVGVDTPKPSSNAGAGNNAGDNNHSGMQTSTKTSSSSAAASSTTSSFLTSSTSTTSSSSALSSTASQTTPTPASNANENSPSKPSSSLTPEADTTSKPAVGAAAREEGSRVGLALALLVGFMMF